MLTLYIPVVGLFLKFALIFLPCASFIEILIFWGLDHESVPPICPESKSKSGKDTWRWNNQSGQTSDLFCWRLFQNPSNSTHPLTLTARPWHMMVEKDYFPQKLFMGQTAKLLNCRGVYIYIYTQHFLKFLGPKKMSTFINQRTKKIPLSSWRFVPRHRCHEFARQLAFSCKAARGTWLGPTSKLIYPWPKVCWKGDFCWKVMCFLLCQGYGLVLWKNSRSFWSTMRGENVSILTDVHVLLG